MVMKNCVSPCFFVGLWSSPLDCQSCRPGPGRGRKYRPVRCVKPVCFTRWFGAHFCCGISWLRAFSCRARWAASLSHWLLFVYPPISPPFTGCAPVVQGPGGVVITLSPTYHTALCWLGPWLAPSAASHCWCDLSVLSEGEQISVTPSI